MTRALGVVLEWGFATLNLEGVHWRAQVGNDASKRVAEKCGFRFEGTARGLLLQRGRRIDGWMGSVVSTELIRRSE
jgi:RimJ/RimL family protein N-acetyltransferase